MNAHALVAACLAAGALVHAAAQRREFLTPAEIDLVREAQEPADRIKLYVRLARVRLDALDKELARESADRAEAIHDLLYEYDRIIDSIDAVADQAIVKRDLVRKGLEAAVKEEPEFLKRLRALEARNPKDLEEYRFLLRQAMETTEDSLEELREHLDKLPADRKKEKEQEKEARKSKEGKEK